MKERNEVERESETLSRPSLCYNIFMTNKALGAIQSEDGTNDYLFRLSAKSLIVNDEGNIFVVKESGRGWWDLPGGGMEHGETIKGCIARELYEEVSLTGSFTYETLLVEDARMLRRANLWQVRLTFVVKPEEMVFAPGEDGDEVAFLKPEYFKQSDTITDQKIYEYWQLAKQRQLI